MAEPIFADGLSVRRSEKAPEFVIANLSFKVTDFVKFLTEHENAGGYVNIDVKKSKNKGTMYGELNTWEKGQKTEVKATVKEEVVEEINPDDIPF